MSIITMSIHIISSHYQYHYHYHYHHYYHDDYYE